MPACRRRSTRRRSKSRTLKRVTHAEVERRVLPLEIVDPPLARGVVGVVQLNTPVEAQHGELDVETQTESRVESQLFVETVEPETVSSDSPDSAGYTRCCQIEEGRAVDHAPDREAQFEVGFQLHVARLDRKIVVGIGHRTLPEGSGCQPRMPLLPPQ